MTQDMAQDVREIGIQELVARLVPGTPVTLTFQAAHGEACRRHRVVKSADGTIVCLATMSPEIEPFVEIVLWAGVRVFLLRDGFMLASPGEICSRYLWGHV